MEALVYFSLCFIFPTILLKIWINEFVRNCRKIHMETTENIEIMIAQNLYVWRKFNLAFGVYLFLHFSINQLLIILHVFLSLTNLLNGKLALDWNSLRQISFQFLNGATGMRGHLLDLFTPTLQHPPTLFSLSVTLVSVSVHF